MNDEEFARHLVEVKTAFDQDDDDFDPLMDGLAVACTEDQWQTVIQALYGERHDLEQRIKKAKARIDRIPSFRPFIKQPIPGIVWVATFADYETTIVLDVCRTRAGAVESAEDHAVMMRGPRRRHGLNWRSHWTPSEWHCPCPKPSCEHEQWTRKIDSGVNAGMYIVQSWSVGDGKQSARIWGDTASSRSTDQGDGDGV